MSACSLTPLSLATAVTIKQKMDLIYTIWLMYIRLPIVVFETKQQISQHIYHGSERVKTLSLLFCT